MATLGGGRKIIDKINVMAKQASGTKSVSVGFLSGSTYPDGTSTPMVAAIQEFGAPAKGIPPRPFFRTMIAQKKGTWGDTVTKNLKATDFNVTTTLNRMGQIIQGQLQQSIRDLTQPALAASTIAAKGFDKPLIDTGHMLNSVAYRVDDK